MLSKVVLFVAGAVIGSVATWKFVKTKYEQIANEEIESVREFYRTKEMGEKLTEGFKNGIDSVDEEVKEKASQAATMIRDTYENYASAYRSEEEEEKEEEEDRMEDKPYVISPEEFGEAGYEQISFTYYADGVLTDEQDYEMTEEEIEESVGLDAVNHFGEFEDDSVFVRNDRLQIDYEILKDLRNYSEV